MIASFKPYFQKSVTSFTGGKSAHPTARERNLC